MPVPGRWPGQSSTALLLRLSPTSLESCLGPRKCTACASFNSNPGPRTSATPPLLRRSRGGDNTLSSASLRRGVGVEGASRRRLEINAAGESASLRRCFGIATGESPSSCRLFEVDGAGERAPLRCFFGVVASESPSPRPNFEDDAAGESASLRCRFGVRGGEGEAEEVAEDDPDEDSPSEEVEDEEEEEGNEGAVAR
mmetsp:Transcript_117074/g.250168  ORF Transcript_117074/g.250168 Transcript_117074/m.250168 type:complete len:198 (-) Transcript_117074:443-1036(-)